MEDLEFKEVCDDLIKLQSNYINFINSGTDTEKEKEDF